jgi:hypothetical protein
MRILAIALAICVGTTGAYAQTAATTPRTPSCHDEATTKKLAGAALTSFMKKCQTDSATVCDTAASDKKLAGAAKTRVQTHKTHQTIAATRQTEARKFLANLS